MISGTGESILPAPSEESVVNGAHAQEKLRQQLTSMFRPQPRALLEVAQHIPMHKRESIMYVVIHLKRETLSQPWGITFSRLDGRLILGNVNNESSRPRIEWCHVVMARDRVLDPRLVLSPMVVHGPVGFYPQNLRLYASGMATPSAINEQLWPGDLVASVDGCDSLCFPDLASFTEYMRSMQQTTLVLLRDTGAAGAALIKWELAKSRDQMRKDMPLVAAYAANIAWQRILGPFPVSTVPPIKNLRNHETPIVRQVTPERHKCAAAPGMYVLGGPRALFDAGPPKTHMPLQTLHPAREQVIASKPKQTSLAIPTEWRNTWFKTVTGDYLPYDDNWEFSPEDGELAGLFIPPIHDFRFWLTKRKEQWRSKYTVFKYGPDNDDLNYLELDERTVAYEFWSQQGCSSFDDWLSTSKGKWRSEYSWNRKKRQRIQMECKAVAQISESLGQFTTWLQVRRNQWRLMRRKRQLERVREDPVTSARDHSLNAQCTAGEGMRDQNMPHVRKRPRLLSPEITDISAIDAIIKIEEEDRKRRESEKVKLVDISFLFFAACGAPDDVVVHCLGFLEPTEYCKLMCISKAYADALKSREEVWRLLCPPHWILPRRPRKPWHELYFHRLGIEYRNSQKRWDDLIVKCSNELFKGDHFQKIEKLVTAAENEFGFHVNYVSPVVCERNCLLNLAVIYRRHKVVRWLVDQKQADIESYDRGHFTALLNAAWAGDRQLVRFLLQRGANRSKLGLNHYTKGLAHPDFMGLTAEGWARKRGHDEIAELIRLGL
jgi:hypothetical protein